MNRNPRTADHLQRKTPPERGLITGPAVCATGYDGVMIEDRPLLLIALTLGVMAAALGVAYLTRPAAMPVNRITVEERPVGACGQVALLPQSLTVTMKEIRPGTWRLAHAAGLTVSACNDGPFSVTFSPYAGTTGARWAIYQHNALLAAGEVPAQVTIPVTRGEVMVTLANGLTGPRTPPRQMLVSDLRVP